MHKIALFLICVSMVSAETTEAINPQDRKATDEAKTLRWKASCFAGATLLAVLAGIVVIAIDGGTSDHHSHHHLDRSDRQGTRIH